MLLIWLQVFKAKQWTLPYGKVKMWLCNTIESDKREAWFWHDIWTNPKLVINRWKTESECLSLNCTVQRHDSHTGQSSMLYSEVLLGFFFVVFFNRNLGQVKDIVWVIAWKTLCHSRPFCTNLSKSAWQRTCIKHWATGQERQNFWLFASMISSIWADAAWYLNKSRRLSKFILV